MKLTKKQQENLEAIKAAQSIFRELKAEGKMFGINLIPYNNSGCYMLMADGGVSNHIIGVVNKESDVFDCLKEVILRINFTTNYLKNKNIEKRSQIPSKDYKKLFTNGISPDIYFATRFLVQFSLRVYKWNGYYYEDITHKYKKDFKNNLPEIEKHNIEDDKKI